ncbi:VOC family protein [Porticoccaceae bacterium]|uniref:2,3-dihydroxybiphenyl 1,2-dioxygenase n=1 Tax=Gammaproteobacteria bacterium LSUCC0057 TaxID=2559237 RepID=A0A4Y8UIV8_9GAMM|nr:VOC family protein [Porticoccaceae bacterium]TFH67744.1 2,3-dihydroxybiphenyl 1,2-dioxygenase [Gammaproteobacteria bacterium LSUCC0057]
MNLIGIGYMGFETANLDAWRDYGPNVMGFEIAASPTQDEHSLYFKMDDRRHRLAFHPGEIDRVTYIGWEARNRLDFIEAQQILNSHGVEFSVGDDTLCEQRGVKELIRFRDPVGYQHEIFYAQKWTPRSFRSGRPHGGFICDDRGLGHVVLMTPTFTEELETFLIEVMGMQWYGWGAGKGKTQFFRTKLNNQTSHDIAFGHAPGRMGIQHIGVFVDSVRDVGETYDIVLERELDLMMTLGQHSQDPHISFYHFNPSGFAFECIAELEPWQGDPFELNPEKMSTWGHKIVGPIVGPSVRPAAEVYPEIYTDESA